MEELRDEWCFDFYVVAADPIPQQMMDDLLWLEAVRWAEEYGLGVGGGFRRV